MNESYRIVLSHDAVRMLHKVVRTFESVAETVCNCSIEGCCFIIIILCCTRGF